MSTSPPHQPPHHLSMIEFFARSRPAYWLTTLKSRGPLADAIQDPLSPLQREQIAAFVSQLNSCGYCTRSHACDVEVLGGEASAISAAAVDIDSAALDNRTKVLLRFVRVLVESPAEFAETDWRIALAGGWAAAELEAAIYVVAQFQFMNTIATGNLTPATPLEVARDLARRRQGPEGYGVVVREIEQRSGCRVDVDIRVENAPSSGAAGDNR